MIRPLAILFLVAMAFGAYAQPPLSKRDQKRKAEFEAKIEAEKNYEETIKQADKAFRDEDYVSARMLYAEAIQYNPENEQWLTSKVNDLDILMAKNIAREVDSVLVMAEVVSKPIVTKMDPVELEKPDVLVQEASEAMTDEPEEPAPEKPRKKEEPEAQTIIEPETTPSPEAGLSRPEERPKPKAAIATPPKPKSKAEIKVKDDFADLPQGMSEERFDFPDHNVWRIVVKDGIDTIVYKEVKHRWGGKFYFKDDVSIAERIWMEEVAEFRKKYPEE